MHKPTAEMKNAAARNDDELLSSAKKLLGLEENLEDLQDDYINLFIKDHR